MLLRNTRQALKQVACPIARTFKEGDTTTCRGAGCPVWRWAEPKCDPAWVAAVKKAAKEIGDNTPAKAKAAEHVNANRTKYGLQEKHDLGYCGMGGPVEVRTIKGEEDAD